MTGQVDGQVTGQVDWCTKVVPEMIHVCTRDHSGNTQMAANESLIKFRGTVNGVTIDRNGVVKKALSKREPTSPRTLENNSEFGTAAKQGKVIREALRILGGDKYLSSRVLKVVRSGIALDASNDRGKRILSNNEAKQVLVGFELNTTNLTSIAPIATKVEAGQLIVNKLGGGNLNTRSIYTPTGTTDIELMAVVAKVNIDPEVLSVDDIQVTTVIAKDGDLVLPTVDAVADPILLTIVAVGIQFHQDVNGKLYSLNNGAYDCARIVDVLVPTTAPVTP